MSAPHTAPDTDPPDHRCGFELLPGDVDLADEYDISDDEELSICRVEFSTACCCREAYEDGRCRWHTEVDAETMREAVAERDQRATNLNGVVVRDVELADGVSFADCRLVGATFDYVTARGADFSDAGLQFAEFPDAYLLEAEFPDADLRRAEFPDASLQYAEFPDADLYRAEFRRSTLHEADLSDANLTDATLARTGANEANFEDATLRDATIHGCAFHQADFTNADARDAEFTAGDGSTPVNLEDAVFRETDLRGADLTDARLYQADLTDARTNRKTRIDGVTIYERRPDMLGWFRDTTDAYGAAAWVHRRMERLSRDNAVSEEARAFHIRKQEAEREGHKRRALRKFRAWRGGANPDGTETDTAETDGGTEPTRDTQVDPDEGRSFLYHAYRFTALSLMYHLSYHGESLQLIGKRAAQIILVAGLAYPLAGGVASDATGTVHDYSARRVATADSLADVGTFLLDSAVQLLWGVYFSIITFTTIGYGDLYPVGTGAKVLVGAESLAGAILVALFVFVLGRRVAR